MARSAQITLWLLLAVIMACGMRVSVAATHKNHIVGGSTGWRTPENKTFYDEWAATRNFTVGDRLVFPYRMGSHNIIEVTAEDFPNCSQKHVINMYYAGPTIVNLTEPGPHYYYCGVGLDCEAGQKLAIVVNPVPLSAGPAPSPDALQSSASVLSCVGAAAVMFMYMLNVLFI